MPAICSRHITYITYNQVNILLLQHIFLYKFTKNNQYIIILQSES